MKYVCIFNSILYLRHFEQKGNIRFSSVFGKLISMKIKLRINKKKKKRKKY